MCRVHNLLTSNQYSIFQAPKLSSHSIMNNQVINKVALSEATKIEDGMAHQLSLKLLNMYYKDNANFSIRLQT